MIAFVRLSHRWRCYYIITSLRASGLLCCAPQIRASQPDNVRTFRGKRKHALLTRRAESRQDVLHADLDVYTLLTFVESIINLVDQVTSSAPCRDAITEMSTYFQEVMHSLL